MARVGRDAYRLAAAAVAVAVAVGWGRPSQRLLE